MPRLSQLKGIAIFADAMSSPIRIKASHVDGVNVLFGHGGAHWVPLDVFKNDENALNDPFATTYNTSVDKIWVAFDKY